jgi:hypothetical protein
MNAQAGIVIVVGMLAMGVIPPAAAQALKTPKPIVIRTGTLLVDFGDSAADSGSKRAIVAKTSALTVRIRGRADAQPNPHRRPNADRLHERCGERSHETEERHIHRYGERDRGR